MSTMWHLLRVILIFSVFLSVWMERVSAISIQLMPPYPAVGQSVTLSVTGITGNIREVKWYKGSNTDASNHILTYIPSANSPQSNGLQYFSRASALPNASLLISDLEFTDGGNYTVSVQTQTAQQTSVNLTVYEPVTDVVLKSNTSEIKENDTVTLTCETKNANRYEWVRVSGSLPSDTIQSKDKSTNTITFPSIKRSAAGDYYCEAKNPASNKKSNIYTLTVNYGPEQVRITGDVNVTEGSSFTLECFAESLPNATFRWTHNGTHLNSCQQRCSLKVASDTQGMYTCIASNSVTNINASTTVNVTVNAASSSPEMNDGPLSRGAIVGIVVAIFAVALIVAVIVLFLMLKQRKKHSASTNRKQHVSATVASGNGQTNESAAEHDIQYTSVTFAQRPPRKVQMQPSDENVVYSDLRLS
uniref:Ig-like domain-containing protein n=1 Tax=Leptobrachium leishanense TaxID=445787 RepID=A0A8C5QAT2_9ANUR